MAAHVRLQDACGCRRSALFCGEDAHLSPFFSPPSRQLRPPRTPVPVADLSSTSIPIVSFSQSRAHREKICLELTLPIWSSSRATERWICFAAGGKRPRRPHIWRSRQRRGSFNKAEKLLESINSVSNVKEEVYGVLDGFVAWELDFPLITVKKALTTLEREKNWPRIIQIIKWMLEKGQGRTIGTYSQFLKALSAESRTQEAQEVFKKVFNRNLECTPLELFSEIMNMYERHEMYEDILEVFADMEELNVRLDGKISGIVSRTYEKIGDMDRAYRVKLKYGPAKFRWRMVNGKIKKFRNDDRDVAVQRWTNDHDSEDHTELDNSFPAPTLTKDQNSDEHYMANKTNEHFSFKDEDGIIMDEGLSDYEKFDDEDLQIEENEYSFTEDGHANEVYLHHLEGKKDYYLQNVN